MQPIGPMAISPLPVPRKNQTTIAECNKKIFAYNLPRGSSLVALTFSKAYYSSQRSQQFSPLSVPALPLHRTPAPYIHFTPCSTRCMKTESLEKTSRTKGEGLRINLWFLCLGPTFLFLSRYFYRNSPSVSERSTRANQ